MNDDTLTALDAHALSARLRREAFEGTTGEGSR